MRTMLGDNLPRPTRPFWSAIRLWGVFFLAALILLPGCGGCRDDPETEAEKEAKRRAEEREKKKPEFETELLGSVPYDQGRTEKKDRMLGCWYKPDHWTTAVLPITANKGDILAELELALSARPDPIGQQLVPLPLPGVSPRPGVGYSLIQCREAALPKGQRKLVQTALFVPTDERVITGEIRMTPRRGSANPFDLPATLSRMPSYQYHLVVLARSPERYGYLRSLPSIKPPMGDLYDKRRQNHYRVSLQTAGRQLALPSEALYWTSIAYVFWDDVDPTTLSVEQRQALVDWLHWGGQLILSGPDTLDTLRDSFLDDYLPAVGDGAEQLTVEALAPINERFTLAGQAPLAPAEPWSGVKLKLVEGAQFVPGTGKLLAERRVGRGRVVVSAMRLSARPLTTWDGFDGFVNACLLRRPLRRYVPSEVGLQLLWADRKNHRFDAALTCQLRYFSRDAGLKPTDYTEAPKRPVEENPTWGPGGMMGASSADEEPLHEGPGVAAWRDFGPVAGHAREALRDAACVQVPDRWFVVWVVAIYLIVLVPLNWLVFRSLGRVEWAWVAAPVIAIVCTFAVIRLAQLDIGFARSETELGILELQDDYHRGHLTRYTALYTSLTTDYAFRHEDAGLLVQPFAKENDRLGLSVRADRSLEELRYRHDDDQGLEGMRVRSNWVDFIHSEQMVELKGPLALRKRSKNEWYLSNKTGVELFGVGVIWRTESDEIWTAWAGDLTAYGTAKLDFHTGAIQDGTWWPRQRDEVKTTSKEPEKGRCNLRRFVALAEQADGLRPGEFRLVGWTTHRFPGLTIRPNAPQAQCALLVVAHLRHALPDAPRPDVNTRGRNASSR